jgi:ATP-dependent helicase/nuclease subunit A
LLRPSDSIEHEGHKFTGGATESKRALARGSHVHRLMQSLPDVPAERRADAARRYLARQKLDDTERTEIAQHTLRLLGDLRFDALFLPGSRAEVSIVGRHNGRDVSGQIDRLVVTPDAVLIADYKTNRPAPNSLDATRTHHADYVRHPSWALGAA